MHDAVSIALNLNPQGGPSVSECLHYPECQRLSSIAISIEFALNVNWVYRCGLNKGSTVTHQGKFTRLCTGGEAAFNQTGI